MLFSVLWDSFVSLLLFIRLIDSTWSLHSGSSVDFAVAVLVSLITTAAMPVAGNDQNLNKFPVYVLCRNPLVRRDPGEGFSVTTVMAQRCLYNGWVGYWCVFATKYAVCALFPLEHWTNKLSAVPAVALPCSYTKIPGLRILFVLYEAYTVS